ncbi:hypothetical protein [Yinghuangia sp. YIM S10712]|uniref:hypothetical protein n=1 Tax=Yinghuangia sp. YIM S10712 TaxID=3436930 RepID=UPI003F52E4C0
MNEGEEVKPLVIGFLMPDVVTTVTEDDDGLKTRYLHRISAAEPSCAAISYGEGRTVSTYAFGPDDLAAEFLRAVRWFRNHGPSDGQVRSWRAETGVVVSSLTA